MLTPKALRAARGDGPADLLLANARIVNVFSREVVPGDIAVADGWIVGFGGRPARRTIDLEGRYVAPGFIDAHVHVESSLTSVTQFVRALLVNGTTTVVADPHEIANVLGTAGIDFMLRSAEGQPIEIFFTLPSCVPATPMETSGAVLSAADLEPFWGHPRVVGLAEVMNFPGVIQADPDVLAKIEAARRMRLTVDGHAPGLGGQRLDAYVAAGARSDHECTDAAEAIAKLRNGMHIMIREGSGAKNLDALLPLVNDRTARRMMFCTDDRNPHDLLAGGHIDAMVRAAVAAGVDPLTAIQMATLNPAEYFGLVTVGAVAPGRRADLVVFGDLERLDVETVFCRGRRAVHQRRLSADLPAPEGAAVPPSMHVDVAAVDFAVGVRAGQLRLIELVPDQLLTGQQFVAPTVAGGRVVADPSRDILKLAVVERHHRSGNVGVGFVRGFGLRQGALASSVAHDSHNIIIAGTDDGDMHAALEAVVRMGGGMAAVCAGSVRASLPLPIAGLMSPEPVERVAARLADLLRCAREWGSPLADPFMTLSFLALPVIPALKLTDKGLIDVRAFAPVPLFV